jgi:N-hydroxyarylamine O-acetyltransferase
MVLRVPVDDRVWLADVGFGAFGLLEPILLREGPASEQGGFTYRLRRGGGLWILSMRDADDIETDLYEFAEDAQTPMDVEVANHFTSTHPESIFRTSLTIQQSAWDHRTILRTDAVTRLRNGHIVDEFVPRARLREVARELFGVGLPETPLVFETVRSPLAANLLG